MARPGREESRVRGILTPELLTLYSLIFADALSRSVVGVSLPLYLRDLGSSAEAYGALVSASRILGMAIGVPAGVLADRLGGALQMALGSIASGLGSAALCAASGVAVAVALYLASYAAGSVARVPTAPMLARLSRGRGLPFGVWGLLLSSAMALGTAGSALVASRLGLRWTFALAGLPLALAGLAALRLPRYGSGRPSSGSGSGGFNPLSALSDLRSMANRGLLARFCVIKSLDALAYGFYPLVPLLGESVGLSATQVFSAYSAGYAARAILSLAGGALADRVDRRRLYSATYVVATSVFACLTLTPRIPVLFYGALLAGALMPLFSPGLLAYTMDAFPEEDRGKAVAIEGTFTRLFGALGPALAGLLSGLGLEVAFAASAGLEALALAVSLTLPRIEAEGRPD